MDLVAELFWILGGLSSPPLGNPARKKDSRETYSRSTTIYHALLLDMTSFVTLFTESAVNLLAATKSFVKSCKLCQPMPQKGHSESLIECLFSKPIIPRHLDLPPPHPKKKIPAHTNNFIKIKDPYTSSSPMGLKLTGCSASLFCFFLRS